MPKLRFYKSTLTSERKNLETEKQLQKFVFSLFLGVYNAYAETCWQLYIVEWNCIKGQTELQKKRVEKTEMLKTLLSEMEFERIREISIDVEYTFPQFSSKGAKWPD